MLASYETASMKEISLEIQKFALEIYNLDVSKQV